MEEKIFVTKATLPPFEEFIEGIKPLWESHSITNMGEYHRKLEMKLSDYLEVPEVSLTVNGHMALELAIQAMDFPKGGEVITTPFTFISTTHAIIRNGLTPVFCDIKDNDFTIDEDKIEELITEKTVAIVPVHVFGNICAVEKIDKIADKYGLKIIYDAAHAFGERYMEKGVGGFGHATIFSFHATKVFNTIEGGAVCCNKEGVYQRLYDLKNFGIRSEELVAEVGANAKMNEFQAIMGICNLKYLEENIKKRELIAEKYDEILSPIKGISMNQKQNKTQYNFAYYPIIIDETLFGMDRNSLHQKLQEEGIYCRKYFYPLTSDQACFKNRYRKLDLKIARYITERVMVLPIYPDMEIDVVERIGKIIRG